MPDFAVVLLIILGAVVIFIAERQQENNIVAAILQNKGIHMTPAEARHKMSANTLYKWSDFTLGLAFLCLGAIISRYVIDDSIEVLIIAMLVASAVAGCAMRANALLRVIESASVTDAEKSTR